MDRFIGIYNHNHIYHFHHLKSNMDRFIEFSFSVGKIKIKNLKSNMDRFIDAHSSKSINKIQI